MAPRAASVEDMGGTGIAAAAPKHSSCGPQRLRSGSCPRPVGPEEGGFEPRAAGLGFYPVSPAHTPSWLPRHTGKANVQAQPHAGRIFYLIKRRTGSPLNPFFSNTIK